MLSFTKLLKDLLGFQYERGKDIKRIVHRANNGKYVSSGGAFVFNSDTIAEHIILSVPAHSAASPCPDPNS